MDAVVYPSLVDTAPGETGGVVEVRVQDPERLRYLDSLDLYPEARVEVVESVDSTRCILRSRRLMG